MARGKLRLDLRRPAPWLLAAYMVLYIPVGLALIYNNGIDAFTNDKLLATWSYVHQAFIFGVFVLILLSPRTLQALRTTAPMWPFVILTLASMTWSADPKLSWAGFELVFGAVIVLPAIYAWLGQHRGLRTTGFLNGLIVVASLVAALVYPARAVVQASNIVGAEYAGAWRGVLIHKNVLGQASCVALLILIQQPRARSLLWWLFAASAAICLVFSRSSNSVLGFGAGLIAYVALSGRVTRRPWALALLGLVICLLAFGLAINVDDLARALGRSSNFSGRTDIWRYALRLIQKQALLGHGYGTVDSAFKSRSIVALHSDAVNPHNGYLDLAFDLGAAGLIALLWGVAVILLRAYRLILHGHSRERRIAICYVSMIVASLTMAMGEAAPLRVDGDGAASFFLALAALSQLDALRRRPVSRLKSSPVRLVEPISPEPVLAAEPPLLS
ncbi:O-antigen ligase family protein [Phenylobacterium montanum]|uniref:O-antigen ligase family protein n=1 Tax=Phenylobacterium montanum TaxID=2823693 RepID=A0A975G1C8_9CAUL|nr:O-antigen ligase family protein [Caulobacter sp. S6]QUD89300.1 O-antigen ligase family protein [Caulobacter sp. S6]